MGILQLDGCAHDQGRLPHLAHSLSQGGYGPLAAPGAVLLLNQHDFMHTVESTCSMQVSSCVAVCFVHKFQPSLPMHTHKQAHTRPS